LGIQILAHEKTGQNFSREELMYWRFETNMKITQNLKIISVSGSAVKYKFNDYLVLKAIQECLRPL
jgi:hypothetical protein